MKKAVLFIAWLFLVGVLYRATLAAEASSFETQLLEAHKTLLSQTTATQEGFTPQAVISPLSEKEPNPFVEMSVSWYRPEELDIIEQKQKLKIIGHRNWKTGVIVFTGDLEATAEPLFPIDSSSGYHLKGAKVDVRITRAGPILRGYSIAGTYKRTDNDNTKPVYLTIYLAPTDHGWETLANNMSLRVDDIGYGSSIEGRINQKGKPELSILGACLGAVRYFSH